METTNKTQQSYWSYIGKWGLIGGVILSIVGMTPVVFDIMPNGWMASLLNFLLYIGIAFFAAGEYRKNVLNGDEIDFGQAFVLGLLSCLMAGVIAGLIYYFYIAFVDVDYLNYILNKQMLELEETGNMSEEQLEQAKNYMKRYSTPGLILVFSVIGAAIVGGIAALISAFIVKNVNN